MLFGQMGRMFTMKHESQLGRKAWDHSTFGLRLVGLVFSIRQKLSSTLKHSLAPHHWPVRGISTLAHKLKCCKHNNLWIQNLNLRLILTSSHGMRLTTAQGTWDRHAGS